MQISLHHDSTVTVNLDIARQYVSAIRL